VLIRTYGFAGYSGVQAAVSIRLRRYVLGESMRERGGFLAIISRSAIDKSSAKLTGFNGSKVATPTVRDKLIGSEDVAVHPFDGGFEAAQNGAAGIIGISARPEWRIRPPPITGDDVRLAKGHLQNFGAADQESVSLNVAAVIVNLFQAIHVGKKQKEWLFRAKGQPDVMRPEKEEATPIVQTGQLVRKGHGTKLVQDFPAEENGLGDFEKQLTEFEEVIGPELGDWENASTWRAGRPVHRFLLHRKCRPKIPRRIGCRRKAKESRQPRRAVERRLEAELLRGLGESPFEGTGKLILAIIK